MNENIEAKYSVLIAGGKWSINQIKELLESGLKVIWFCLASEKEQNKKFLDAFCKVGFCEIYENASNVEILIEDGKDVSDDTLKILENGDPGFNIEQYIVEHQSTNKNLMIEAGAGTGKTHVMINRIMYLMHMDSEFNFFKVAMITFTNKATDNMRHRLINTLDAKYKLTGKLEYLDRIEELAQISVSTIHSFFKKVIVEVGPALGYGSNIQLKSYIYEKKELLKDLLNKRYKQSGRVEDVIGLPLHLIEKLALEYWGKLDNNGLSEEEIQNLNWGSTLSVKAELIQKSLVDIFRQVDDEYNNIKYVNNAISMQDIIHELSRVIHLPEIKDYISHNYKYMFVDEFQDSDNVQIQTIAILNRVYEGNLFVVGDIKQSIYRFRGATDSAFSKLNNYLTEDERERLIKKSLTKNYRTSETVMGELDSIFQKWGNKGLNVLQYEDGVEHSDRLIPQVKEKGIYSQQVIKESEREKKVIQTIKKIQNESKYKKVTCLTRKNSQLRTIKSWCEKEKIVCLIKEKGSFFISDAVLDFCSLLEAYLYDNEPMFLYNYIISSYGSGIVEYSELEKCNGDKGQIFKVLLKQIDVCEWENNRQELKNKPIMSVIRRMVSEIKPVEKYATRRKKYLISNNYPESKAVEQTLIDVTQYEANLKKLLQLMTDQFSGDFASLLDLCNYIRIKIMTDREEEPAEIQSVKNIDYVEGMTVHGAKGLEFENVLIPFMNDSFYQTFRSEILVSQDHHTVGWVYREKGNPDIKNNFYDLLIHEEKEEVTKEESRLLYVAMTRAIYGLYCFVIRKETNGGMPSNWAGLLPKEKDDARSI